MRTDVPWTLQGSADLTEPLVDLNQLKEFLRISGSDEDSVLASLAQAAEDAVELELSRSLVTQTWVLRLDRFPCWEIGLPKGPVSSLTKVEYIDSDGATQTLAGSVYTFDANNLPPRIHLAYNQAWPATRSVPNAVIVTYVAGQDRDAVPEMIRTAVKLMAGDMYENRERSGPDALRELALYEILLANYRNYWEPRYA